MYARLLAAFVLLVGSGCYRPHPQDGSFRCSPDLGGLCPEGLTCSPAGLCVTVLGRDMGGGALDLAGDQAQVVQPRSCDERIAAGAFANLTPLSAVNSAVDEEHLALDPSPTAPRLIFQRGSQLFSASIDPNDPKSIGAPQPVSLSGGPVGLEVQGSSFGADGRLWLAGTVAGTTSLYAATPNAGTDFSVGAAHAPTSSACAFADPFFRESNPGFELYVSYALAGCGGPSYVTRGALDRNLGAFYSALPDAGWAAPSVSPSGLLLLVSSTVGGRHLYSATRADAQYQFTSAGRVPMSTIGEPLEDRQAVVSHDCATIYFSSVRSGGTGGADLYAADILPN